MALQSINPFSQALLQTYAELTHKEVETILAQAHHAFLVWRKVPDRTPPLRQLARLLRDSQESLARLMANEMGKPIRQGRSEIEKCAVTAEFFAEHGPGFLEPEAVTTEARLSQVVFPPLGVVLAIMPWNFPFWQAMRAAIPALLAGNAMVLKHASNVSGCALAIESLLHQAGFPAPLFRTLLMGSSHLKQVIGHPLIQGVTLTGSTAAGQAVAAQAGAALKKTVLELGGSDPYLVLADADVKAAAAVCAASRLINGGQSCIAAKRFIVERPVLTAFTDEFVAALKKVTLGNPLEEQTDLGPLARLDLRQALHHQVERSIAAGAELLLGGKIPPGPGAFYPPTVLGEVHPGQPAFEEELFGPVAAIVPADHEAEAIRLANSSEFGLGAAVFTRDLERGERITREELQAGSCFVNAAVHSDPRLPFGGIKHSGYGRELSWFGIREFVNIKTLYVGG